MPAQCDNCSAPIEGSFCARCGQPDRTIDVPIGTFAKDLVTETFDLDSRLRRTLYPLFLRPGAVPKAYVEGHRARFVPPVRLYLFASFLMFLMFTLSPSTLNVGLTDSEGNVISSTDPSSAQRLGADPSPAPNLDDSATSSFEDPEDASSMDRLGARIAAGMSRMVQDREAFTRDFMNRLAQAMFFLLPAFALLLKVVNRRRLYVHHLVFAVYFHSFAFLLMALLTVPGALRLEGMNSIAKAGLLLTPAYLYLGMRRFYEESRTRTFLKCGLVSFVYFNLSLFTVIGLLVISLIAF